MWSRYDFMSEGKVNDIDGNSYPDPLSINFVETLYTKVPTILKIAQGDIFKFWLTMHNNYGLTDHDDVLLGLNGVPYIGMLKPGDEIYKIDVEDLENFNTRKRLESA